jgi:hypothetical protein
VTTLTVGVSSMQGSLKPNEHMLLTSAAAATMQLFGGLLSCSQLITLFSHMFRRKLPT